jgi:hypothetical protein
VRVNIGASGRRGVAIRHPSSSGRDSGYLVAWKHPCRAGVRVGDEIVGRRRELGALQAASLLPAIALAGSSCASANLASARPDLPRNWPTLPSQVASQLPGDRARELRARPHSGRGSGAPVACSGCRCRAPGEGEAPEGRFRLLDDITAAVCGVADKKGGLLVIFDDISRRRAGDTRLRPPRRSATARPCHVSRP